MGPQDQARQLADAFALIVVSTPEQISRRFHHNPSDFASALRQLKLLDEAVHGDWSSIEGTEFFSVLEDWTNSVLEGDWLAMDLLRQAIKQCADVYESQLFAFSPEAWAIMCLAAETGFNLRSTASAAELERSA